MTGGRRVAFVEVKAPHAGADLFEPLVGRGAAYADIDGDGDLDVLVTANVGRPHLLRNDGGNKNHFLRVVLEGDGVHSNRSALGALVEARVGDRTMRQELMGGRGYLSQPELVLTFGVGDATEVDELTVIWPGGAKQTITHVLADQLLRIRQQTEQAN